MHTVTYAYLTTMSCMQEGSIQCPSSALPPSLGRKTHFMHPLPSPCTAVQVAPPPPPPPSPLDPPSERDITPCVCLYVPVPSHYIPFFSSLPLSVLPPSLPPSLPSSSHQSGQYGHRRQCEEVPVWSHITTATTLTHPQGHCIIQTYVHVNICICLGVEVYTCTACIHTCASLPPPFLPLSFPLHTPTLVSMVSFSPTKLTLPLTKKENATKRL